MSYNGDCSSVAEHTTVARGTRVRFSPFALLLSQNRIEQGEIDMKKIKEVFETGGGDIDIWTSLNNGSIISLTLLAIYAVIAFTLYLFFNPSETLKYIINILGIILALFAISIRVFGLRGWRKAIKRLKK